MVFLNDQWKLEIFSVAASARKARIAVNDRVHDAGSR
jgi:hypothetical protein